MVLALVQSVSSLVVDIDGFQSYHLRFHVGLFRTTRLGGHRSLCALSGIQTRRIALCDDFLSR